MKKLCLVKTHKKYDFSLSKGTFPRTLPSVCFDSISNNKGRLKISVANSFSSLKSLISYKINKNVRRSIKTKKEDIICRIA